jgi:FecR protein
MNAISMLQRVIEPVRRGSPAAFAILAGALFALGALESGVAAAQAPMPAMPPDQAMPQQPGIAADALPSRVGRLSNMSGQVYVAPHDNSGQWSPIDLNYPVMSGDNLWTDPDAHAEVDFGGSQLRMSTATNVNVGALDDHNVDLFVAQGDLILRVAVLEPGDSAVIDTPTTQVVLRRPGLYRVAVSPDQQQTAVTVREGEVTAQVTAGLQQVLPGMTAVVVAGDNVAARFSAAAPQDAFDGWSAERERAYRQVASTNYVSPQMVGAADLGNYGNWQSMPDYGNVWFPNSVPAGWAPYSTGYWTTLPGFGFTWVDAAPWGYAPFHYGRWAFIGGRWGWAPGAYVVRPVWAPALVAWTGGGISVVIAGGGPVYGWVPLGWREPYHPWWGSCGGACWDRYNRPYQVDARYRDQALPPDRYANWRVPGAVTAVAGANLIARKPYIAGQRVSLTGTAIASTKPLSYTPPSVAPRPGAIPVVAAGAHGTPKPAAAYYATSKPARMGLTPAAVTHTATLPLAHGAAVTGAAPGPSTLHVATPLERQVTTSPGSPHAAVNADSKPLRMPSPGLGYGVQPPPKTAPRVMTPQAPTAVDGAVNATGSPKYRTSTNGASATAQGSGKATGQNVEHGVEHNERLRRAPPGTDQPKAATATTSSSRVLASPTPGVQPYENKELKTRGGAQGGGVHAPGASNAGGGGQHGGGNEQHVEKKEKNENKKEKNEEKH